jgi:hypothetical protein
MNEVSNFGTVAHVVRSQSLGSAHRGTAFAQNRSRDDNRHVTGHTGLLGNNPCPRVIEGPVCGTL